MLQEALLDPIYLFTIAGGLAMAGALSSRQVMQDALTKEQAEGEADNQQPVAAEAAQESVAKRYLIAGNLAVIALVMAMVYGWQEFVWWIPAAFLVVTFPALYYVFFARMLTSRGGALLYTLGAWAALVPVIGQWIA